MFKTFWIRHDQFKIPLSSVTQNILFFTLTTLMKHPDIIQNTKPLTVRPVSSVIKKRKLHNIKVSFLIHESMLNIIEITESKNHNLKIDKG